MLALQQYNSSDDEQNEEDKEAKSASNVEASSEYSIISSLQVCAAPVVLPTVSRNSEVIFSRISYFLHMNRVKTVYYNKQYILVIVTSSKLFQLKCTSDKSLTIMGKGGV